MSPLSFLSWLMVVTMELEEVGGPCASRRQTATKPFVLSRCDSLARVATVHSYIAGFLLENVTGGEKTDHRESLREQ